MTDLPAWCEDWSEVIAFAEWMHEERDLAPSDIFYLLRKPWKYTAEHDEWIAEKAAKEHAEALNDTRFSAGGYRR